MSNRNTTGGDELPYRDRYRVARHEIGHAVAYWALGHAVTNIEVPVRRATAEAEDYFGEATAKLKAPVGVRARIMLFMAGHMAEQDGCVSNPVFFGFTADRYSKVFSGDNVGLRGRKAGDDLVHLACALLPVPPAHRREVYDEALEALYWLLRANRRTITKWARVLAKAGTLTCAEQRRLMEEVRIEGFKGADRFYGWSSYAYDDGNYTDERVDPVDELTAAKEA